ncbi:hypothetical protein [Rhizobium leguminosarum]|uniref:hypothetical protein n=1 Tax=Rhizobium leguminosarum TaxID=384 RepID=UPI0019824ECE|nr:hypothetical protein [Rhizobium leguminosarum]
MNNLSCISASLADDYIAVIAHFDCLNGGLFRGNFHCSCVAQIGAARVLMIISFLAVRIELDAAHDDTAPATSASNIGSLMEYALTF